MDEKLKNLLQKWKLEELVGVFEEQRIGYESFKLLEEDELKFLVPKIGHRVVLRAHLLKIVGNEVDIVDDEGFTEDCQKTASPSDQPLSFITGKSVNFRFEEKSSPSTSTALDKSSAESSRSVEVEVPEPIHRPILCEDIMGKNITISMKENPKKRKRTDNSGDIIEFINNKFDLNQVLQETCMGKAIIATYKASNYLSSKCQGYLTDIIASYFLDGDFPRLNNQGFQAVAKAIQKIFPNEKREVYYTPPIRKRENKNSNKSISAKGKFTDKYRNKITFLREAKILPNLRFSFQNEDVEDESDSEGASILDSHASDDLIWLKNNTEPWNIVQEKWSQTFELRKKYLHNSDVYLTDIFREWPILNINLSYTLIEQDFAALFPETDPNQLFKEFDLKFMKLLKIRKHTLNHSDSLYENIISSKSLNTEYRHYLMLFLLSSLIPCTTKLCKGKKAQWRPTVQDCRESVITRVELPGDIEDKIKERKDANREKGTTLQPFIIAEIEEDTIVNNVYVCVQDTLYKVPNTLKAIDVCFKIFYVFGLKYPAEAQHLWQFIQLAIFGISDKNTTKIPSVIDIVNKVTHS